MTLNRDVIRPADPTLDLGARSGLPMSAGIAAGPLIFLSGLCATDPATGEPWHGSAIQETRLVLDAMRALLEERGSSLDRVVKLHVFLYSMLELDNVNAVCRSVFTGTPPARTVCGVALHGGAKVEFDCIALAGPGPSGAAP